LVRIKNALAGVLHITSAKIRLEGHEIKEVVDDTPEISQRADEGLIELVPEDYEPQQDEATLPPSSETPVDEPPEDFDTLDETDAIEFIEAESDPSVIQSILLEEERPGVIDALKARLQEIEDAGQ